jgi:hypothetical protein
MCNNLVEFPAIELLSREIVVFFATFAGKTWISLPNVVQDTTHTDGASEYNEYLNKS